MLTSRTLGVRTGPTVRPNVLVVGSVRGLRDLPEGTHVTRTEFHKLNPRLIDRLRPNVILSLVFSKDFDCLDLAAFLENSGYTGRYRAVTFDLPNSSVVRSEVRAGCPNIDFDILHLGTGIVGSQR